MVGFRPASPNQSTPGAVSDGGLVLSASDDGTVRIWKCDTGMSLAPDCDPIGSAAAEGWGRNEGLAASAALAGWQQTKWDKQ